MPVGADVILGVGNPSGRRLAILIAASVGERGVTLSGPCWLVSNRAMSGTRSPDIQQFPVLWVLWCLLCVCMGNTVLLLPGRARDC